MLKKGLASVAVIALVLAASGYLALRHRARVAGDRLAELAEGLGTRRIERTPHAEDPAAPPLADALAFHAADPAWTEECSAAARAEAPIEALPEVCSQIWQKDREWSLAVVRSSRSPRWAELPQDRTAVLLHAMRVAALELQKNPAGSGAELCLDLLALARDRALGGGVIAMAVAASIVHEVAQPCRAPLASATEAQRRALEGIQQSWPRPGDWVAYELINLSGTFYPVLTDAQLARIPQPLRSPVDVEASFAARLVLMEGLPGFVTLFERIEKAAALERGKRDAQLAAIEAAEAASWNPWRRMSAPSFGKFFARDDRCRDELEVLCKSAR